MEQGKGLIISHFLGDSGQTALVRLYAQRVVITHVPGLQFVKEGEWIGFCALNRLGIAAIIDVVHIQKMLVWFSLLLKVK